MEQRAEYINRIGILMNENELSQDAFAASIGLNRDRVNNWLNGRSKLDVDSLVKISREYGVSSDWILGLKPIDARSPDSSIQGAAAVTGLSEKAINNLILDFRHEVSPEYQEKYGLATMSALSPMLEEDRFLCIIYELVEYCRFRNSYAEAITKLNGKKYDRVTVFDFGYTFTEEDLKIYNSMLPKKVREAKEYIEKDDSFKIMSFMQDYSQMNMQHFELTKQWSDFLEAFIPSKEVLADGMELYKEYKDRYNDYYPEQNWP